MANESDDARQRARRRNDLSRTVQFYSLLIAAVGCANLWIYWVGGSRLSLGLGVVAFVCLAAWLLYARSVLRDVGRG